MLDASIKRRLLACFGAAILSLGVLIGGMIAIQVSLSNELFQIYSSNNRIVTLNGQVQRLGDVTERYLSTKTTDALEELHNIMNELSLMTYEMKKTAPSSQINMKIRDVGNMADRLMEHTNTAIKAKMSSNTDEYIDSFSKVITLMGYIDTQCTHIGNLITAENISAIQMHSARQTQFYRFASLFVLLIIIEIVGYIIISTRSITNPIIEMADRAKAISAGNLEIEDVTCETHDEVATLAATFNRMKRDIRENIHQIEAQQQLKVELLEKESENYKIKLMLQDAQLMAMQSQIQPHFLFNTINAGLQIAYREGAGDTVEYFSKMSDFLRYNLKNFWEPVTLYSEVEQIRRYFYIMEVRFGGQIHFQVEEEIGEEEQRLVLVPCMILQPLVENCYVHGIKKAERRGEIRIVLCEFEGRYAVRIIDNGVGMGPEQVAYLMAKEPAAAEGEKDVRHGLGVRNVAGRLRSYFRREDIIRIYSTVGIGTEVVLLLKEKNDETSHSG